MFCLNKEDEPVVFATNSLQRRKKGLGLTGLRTPASLSTHSKSKMGLLIGRPQNFRQISSIIDVDILPETHRRVRLHKHGTHKPLGFYIRDGASMRVTPYGVEKVGLIILYEHIHNIVQYGQHLKTLLGASKLKPPMASSSLYSTKARTFASVWQGSKCCVLIRVPSGLQMFTK